MSHMFFGPKIELSQSQWQWAASGLTRAASAGAGCRASRRFAARWCVTAHVFSMLLWPLATVGDVVLGG